MDYSIFLNNLKELSIHTSEQNKPESFNIFRSLEIENKEVLSCRFLGALLEPNGTHGLGELPIKSFLIQVLKVKDVSDKPSVNLEEVIKDNRRVDIVIRNSGEVYPIEVKIWAGDQDVQLADYFNYYFPNGENEDGKKIYYLTPTGWAPSKKSRGRLCEEQIICLSFEKDIKQWLEYVAQDDSINIAVKSIIDQYIEVIEIMNKEAQEEKKLFESLNLGDHFEVTDELKTLVTILKLNGDTNGKIQKKLQEKYLRAKLKYNADKYDLVVPSEDVKKNIDSHYRVCIESKEKNEIIAAVCVDTNLYISCCKKLKAKHKDDWKGESWAYIRPAKYPENKTFKLNDCENIIEEKYGDIEIEEYLEDIDDSE